MIMRYFCLSSTLRFLIWLDELVSLSAWLALICILGNTYSYPLEMVWYTNTCVEIAVFYSKICSVFSSGFKSGYLVCPYSDQGTSERGSHFISLVIFTAMPRPHGHSVRMDSLILTGSQAAISSWFINSVRQPAFDGLSSHPLDDSNETTTSPLEGCRVRSAVGGVFSL